MNFFPGEEETLVEGLKSWALAPKVLQNLKGSAEPFFNRLFPMRKVPQNLPAELGSPGPSSHALQILLPFSMFGPLAYIVCTKGPPPPEVKLWSLTCDPIGQLQVGNEPEIGNGRKNGRRNGRRPFFGGRPDLAGKNGRANGRIAEIWPFSACPAICPGHFSGHFGPSPKNGRRPFRRPFFGHFRFRAHFPPVAGQWGRKV